MVKKLSITQKVFLLTSAMFCVYLVLIFFGQIVFYGEIYTYYKRQELTKQVDALSEQYVNMSTNEQINEALINFSKSNDSYVLIMGERGNILYTASYEMSIRVANGDTVRVTIDNAVHDKGFSDLNLKVGDSVIMEYYQLPSQDVTNVYIPVSISKGTKVWHISYNNASQGGRRPDSPLSARREPPHEPSGNIFRPFTSASDEPEKHHIAGIVTSITLPDEHNFQSSMRRAESALAAINWIGRINNSENLAVGDTIHYIYTADNTLSKYIVVVKKVATDSGAQMVFAVNTLKSVDEAVNVMKDSYITWAAIAFLMVILMSLIFSKFITRPIVNITQVTTKMKNLDFSQKCAVQSDDEVGRLAANINDMSQKLDTTIRELVASNEKLTSDIEHERKMELARREFVAAVSHELKTPLAIIRAYSEGIADGATGERRDKYLNVIIDETKKMDALVLDMLENSRLESGAYKLKIKNYDMSTMTRKIISRLKNATGDKSIEFVTDIPETSVNADFDIDMLEQVINNFISNAIRHTPDSGKIYVTVYQNNGDAVFSVENEGKQIDEQIIDKVWDRFYKADKSRDRSSGGTGLGLSIAKNILLLHKARYGVENTMRGVKFWFRLKKE